MNSGIEILQFDGPLHMVESIRQVESDPGTQAEFAERDFHGCPWPVRSVQDLRDALTKTWKEGIELVEQTVRDLAEVELPEPKARRRAKVWADDGDEVSIDRLERGQPCWRSTRRRPMPGSKVVTLCVGVAASAVYKHADLAWRTAAAIAIADLIEPAGFSCDIVAYRYSGRMYEDGRDSLIVVPVKEASAPLDIGTLVNAMSPWFYRTAFFASGRIGGAVCGGQGRPLKIGGTSMTAYVSGGSEAYVLDSVVSRETAIEAVRKILSEIETKQEAA